MAPRPLSECPIESRRRVKAVLTDIDDTLTEGGRLPAKAYAAMEGLRRAGLILVPVTGRPAGWCDLIARQWPVDGVVGENGAFYFRYDDASRTLVRRYAKSENERREDARTLARIRDAVLAEVPGAAVASDQAYREADLAIDVCEDVAALPRSDVLKVLDVFRRFGATAKVSSIHVNGWLGGYDKLSTCRELLGACFGIDADREPEVVAFVGDSPNDASMFAHFPFSVGVANVLDFSEELTTPPAFVARFRGGSGFAELADLLIAARR